MQSIPLTQRTISSLKISEAVEGQGRPLLMLHGWGAHSGLLWPLAQRLLTQGYRVYVPDLPGFGQSEAPPQAWSVYDYADFVLAYMDAHELEQTLLFGHSFGGRLGLILGAKHGQRFEKMVLADAAGIRTQAPLLQRLRLGAYKNIRDGLYRVGARGLADALRARYNARYGSADFQSAGGVMREVFVKVVNEDLLPLAAQVRPPTLLLWGERDEDTPLWQGQLLEKTIPDAGLVVFEGAGHYSYLEQAARSAQIMDYFFKQG